MRGFDFSSWQAVLTTLLGLAVITLLGVGIRLLVMQTVQQRRERENRQINERLAVRSPATSRSTRRTSVTCGAVRQRMHMPRYLFEDSKARTARAASATRSRPHCRTSSG